MKDYKTLILVILAMITIVEFTIKTIPDKNKKNGGSGFAMFTYNKGIVKVCIGSFVFMTLFCGFVFVKTFIDDGGYIFWDKKTDLNSAAINGETPEMGGYVSVRFNVVGKAFCPEGREGVYYPIIIYDESGNSDNKVCAIHVNESERDLFEKYSADSIKSLDEDSGVTPYPVLEYSGRILEIHVYIGLYDTTVRDSEMAGQGFEIKKYVVDATVDKKEMKKSLIDIGVMMIGCLIGAVVVTVVWKKRTGEGE